MCVHFVQGFGVPNIFMNMAHWSGLAYNSVMSTSYPDIGTVVARSNELLAAARRAKKESNSNC